MAITEYPKLRYGLEAFPVKHEGKQMVLLRDRIGYCEDPLLLSPAVAGLLMQMNGENSLRDLQVQYMRMTGELLYMENLEAILKMLDDRFFLENDRFIERARQEVARFLNDPVRGMRFAGKSYPTDPRKLSQVFESFFLPENDGPGLPEKGSSDRRIVGLVAPHIDIQAGGPCFAHAYKVCMESQSPSTWLILGTGHEPLENHFALCPKDFETPFGIVGHDSEFCRELIRICPKDIRASEYCHDREHTIEFQAVFLGYAQPDCQIVPLLCSFTHEDWARERSYIDEVASILKELSEEEGRSVGVIASVDLAHIGPRYGDAIQPHRGTIAEHLDADRELLEALEAGDALKFMDKIQRERNRRKICGVAPLYMLAKILEGRAQGRTLKLSHAVVDQQNSFVTFASMVFYAAAGK